MKLLVEQHEQFEKLRKVERSINIEKDFLKKADDETFKIPDRLEKNEIGDAEVFIDLFKDKYLFDPTEGNYGFFYFWNGRHWEKDVHKERYKDFEEVPLTYKSKVNEVDADVKDALVKRANQLRTHRRPVSVFDTVSAYLSFRGKWDYIPYLLPCANGVIDLKTGDFKAFDRNHYNRKISPVNFNQEAIRPKFDQFLKDIFLDDKELIGFIQRLFGYVAMGVPAEEIIIYLYGLGRNGKGTLVKLIVYVLGALARTFPVEMLLLQRNPLSSSAPSPELANLEGVRAAIFSEINKGRKIDSAKVKNLSGRDLISCRKLYSNVDLQIEPTHTLLVQTNHKPEAPVDDRGLWSRTILIPFNASFVRNPKGSEKPLNEKLKDELLAEAEGILLWLVEGCLAYQELGLNVPEAVRRETEAYRQQNDGIGHFLNNMCERMPEFSVKTGEFSKAIQAYCEREGFTIPTQREISDYLKKEFGESNRTAGCRFWKGVRVMKEND